MTVPTIGYNVETVVHKNVEFRIWDLGGQEKIRLIWHHYFSGSDAIVYVVDSSDREKLADAREELAKILQSKELAGLPLLVFANKQDLPDALKGD